MVGTAHPTETPLSSSLPRKQEFSDAERLFWTPAFSGVTEGTYAMLLPSGPLTKSAVI
jgi:hypothetical protein